MKRSESVGCMLALAAVFACVPAQAAAINGMIRSKAGPLANAAVRLQCGGAASPGRTDERGYYALSINASGLCTLTVNDGNSASVLLGPNPVRYDFDVPADARAPLVQR